MYVEGDKLLARRDRHLIRGRWEEEEGSAGSQEGCESV